MSALVEPPAPRIRLVATDLDGTLLDAGGGISARTARVLDRVARAGAVVAVATGRPLRALSPLRAAGFAGRVIAQNGAVLYDLESGGRRVRSVIDPGSLRAFATDLSDVVPEAMLAVQVVDDEGEGFFADPGFPLDGYRDLDRAGMSRLRVVRALLFHPDPSARLPEVAENIARGRLHVTRSRADGLVELSAPGVTKGAALAELAESLGIERDAVLAFGDMPNDVEMLLWAGTGVAMANAEPAVLEIADAVTTSNDDDGVAGYLERTFGLRSASPGCAGEGTA